MPYKLGLKPPVPGAVRLRLATYLDFRKLPEPPPEFGHYQLVDNWQMFANDLYGDCGFAGAAHQEMLYGAEAGHAPTFSDATVLADYGAVTGFTPDNPDSDQGTQISDLARYWRRTGLVDTSGGRHNIVAFCDLNPGDLRELWVATYLFQAIGLGFEMPASAIDQTQRGQVWDVVDNDGGIQGGHYVPSVGRTGGLGICVTWGQLQPFTPAFYAKYNTQGLVVFDEEMLVKGQSIDGFDHQLLHADLQTLSQR